MIARAVMTLILVCAPRAALAGGERADDVPAADGRRLVIESHVGERPDDAEILIAPVRSMLQARGDALGDAVVERAHERLPAPNDPPPPHLRDELQERLDRGFRHWDDVEFGAAIEVLERALAMAGEHPRMITESSTLRDRLFRAHIVLALAHKRSQEERSAREVMKDLVRTFPGRDIPFEHFGPEPEKLREDVEAELSEQGTAHLMVGMRGPNATAIFINERFVGAGAEVNMELYPGRYRVFALTEAGPGRIRNVALSPGDTQQVTIDPTFDRALELLPQPSLVFEDEEERRRRERDYAVRLASAADAEGGAVLLGLQEREGRRVLHGRALSPEGDTLREGWIPVEGGVPVEDLYALGAFLVGESPEPEVEVVDPIQEASAPERPERFGAWSWVAMGAGAAGVSTGIVLWRLDGRGSCSDEGRLCPRLYDTRDAGIAGVALGAATFTAGLAGWIYDARRSERARRPTTAAIAPAPDRGWLMILQGEF